MHTCPNCENSYDESYQYCPYCGQKSKDELTMSVLFQNTISNYFSVDARFFRSFLPLVAKPGVLARRFVDGKRQLYLHPAQYYLFVSVIFFFLFSLETRNQEAEIEQAVNKMPESTAAVDSLINQELSEQQAGGSISEEDRLEAQKQISEVKTMFDSSSSSSYYAPEENYVPGEINFNMSDTDSLIKAGAPEEEILKEMGYQENDGKFKLFIYKQAIKLVRNRGKGALNAFYDSIPIAMFFLLPVFALMLKLIYWKSGPFSYHMVFSFYYFTFVFLMMSLFFAIDLIFGINGGWFFLIMPISFIYLWLSSRNFYTQGWAKTFFKSGFLSFCYGSFVIPVAMVILAMVTFFLY